MVICAYCQKQAELVRDHVVPRSRGGPDNATNIVMACDECNNSKRDSLASEWLGERCPKEVLEIENRVHQKLERRFAKRDKKYHKLPQKKSLFAFHLREGCGVDWVGEIISEENGMIRMEIVDAVFASCGLWELCGELKIVPSDQ